MNQDNNKPLTIGEQLQMLKNQNTNKKITPKESLKETPKITPKESLKQTPKITSKESLKETSKIIPKDNLVNNENQKSNTNKPVVKNNNKSTNIKKPKVEKKEVPSIKQAPKRNNNRKPQNINKNKILPKVNIIPLGGLNEIGKNITVYECQDDMFIVDCGLAFPDADMLGVDLVIPDFTFIEQNITKIKGLCITHGHEDHIGAIPYLLKKFDIPIYASRLAIGLIKGKLKEHGLSGYSKFVEVSPRQQVKMGCMTVEFIRVNHSIPDAMGCVVHTPAGIVVQTGDFKIDYTPIEGEVIDISRFAQLGNEGVLCLLSDSTNAERPGSTMSERKVGQSFLGLFSSAEGKRIIIASFASNIHRIQQIVNNAEKFGRKVAVSGRSMENVVAVAIELGYLTIPKGMLIDVDAISKYPPDKLVIITTGSQGEPMSALSRMASGEHRKVCVTSNDFIIISATPIPGNEKHVTKVVNDLLKLGAEVIYEGMYEVHVSGHACQDELKTMLAITKPKFFIPVHGEFKHLKAHSRVAKEMGIKEENIHIGEIGQIISLDKNKMAVTGSVDAGGILVDGLGIGDVGSIVLRDRRHLSQDGLMVIVVTIDGKTSKILSGPDIISRGFVYVRESEELLTQARAVVKNALELCLNENIKEWATLKNNVKDELSNFIYKKTKREPMILPIITE
ncbi:MAG: ribonuclease J, partial [Oscillospiraceae bacterium]